MLSASLGGGRRPLRRNYPYVHAPLLVMIDFIFQYLIETGQQEEAQLAYLLAVFAFGTAAPHGTWALANNSACMVCTGPSGWWNTKPIR